MQRHDLDLLSLACGVAFIALGLVILGDELRTLESLRWVLPLLLVGLGGAILLHAIANRPRESGEGGDSTDATDTVPEAEER